MWSCKGSLWGAVLELLCLLKVPKPEELRKIEKRRFLIIFTTKNFQNNWKRLRFFYVHF